MSLSKDKINEINQKKIISFLNPLLLGIQDDESIAYNKFVANIKNKTSFDFNKNFIMFSDIQIYRHISILGILNTFDRTLKYKVLNLALLLDVWYNESTMYNKDELRTCDLLIIYGINDKKFGANKSAALISLISIRKSLGKLTWIFIRGCSPEEYSLNQPGLLDEIKNIYNIELNNKTNLTLALSKLQPLTLGETLISTEENTEEDTSIVPTNRII